MHKIRPSNNSCNILFEDACDLCYYGPAMEISILFDEGFEECLDRGWLQDIAKQALTAQGIVNDAEMGLVVASQKRVQELNKTYLNRDEPTDVLSFPIREKAADDKYYLGDIIISAHQAFKQCSKKNYGLEEELQILTIHGFLHLLGFEHEKDIEEEEQKISQLLIGRSHGN